MVGAVVRMRALARAVVTASVLVIWACDRGLQEVRSTVPEVLSVEVVDRGPIFRTLVVSLDRNGAVRAEYGADGQTLMVESDGSRSIHEIVLPRLHADDSYSYAVYPVAEDGAAGVPVDGGFSTSTLPEALENLEVEFTGIPTFEVLLLEPLSSLLPFAPLIVDREGRIVWYSVVPGRGGGGFTVLDDSLFVRIAVPGIQVFSPLSQEPIWSLTRDEASARTGVDPFHMHHDVVAGPDGTVLFLVVDTALVRDTVWRGEAIWEWDPRTDELDRRWRSADFLDPSTDRGSRTRASDWLHANSLHLGPRGNVLVSLFWLHQVLSISPGWDRLEWRLGGPGSTFTGVERAMEAGQHTAAEVAPDRVLLFDNGRDRSEGLYSRVLEIALNREAGTADIAWEFRPEPDIYAPVISSARRMENGHTVMAFGTAEGFRATEEEPPASGPIAFYEVDPAGEVIWRMEITEGAELVYRATPLASVAGERQVR